MKLFIPADVPHSAHEDYKQNYNRITKNTGKLVLFACDQKIEHLNDDYYGHDIHPDTLNPEHMFRIASQGTIGAMATHLGLITRYATAYPNIHYIVKLNGKTNIAHHPDPLSALLWEVDDIMRIKEQTQFSLCGIGLTVYLGSKYEHIMLTHAAQAIMHAHQYGLITILWMYPRGKGIIKDRDPQLLAGAAGVAHALGSDFVKIKSPEGPHQAEHIRMITTAAGNTKVICSGGPQIDPLTFLEALSVQINNGYGGSATGRNIFQKSLAHAIAMTHAISALVLENQSAQIAYDIFKNK